MRSLLEIVNIALANRGVSCFFRAFLCFCATHKGKPSGGMADLVTFTFELSNRAYNQTWFTTPNEGMQNATETAKLIYL